MGAPFSLRMGPADGHGREMAKPCWWLKAPYLLMHEQQPGVMEVGLRGKARGSKKTEKRRGAF